MVGSMKSNRYNKTVIGLVLGLFMPILGFVIYGAYWSWKFHRTFSYFVNDVFLGTPAFRSSIIALSLLINLIPFFLFLRKEYYYSARGVIAAVFVYVPFVVYFHFF